MTGYTRSSHSWRSASNLQHQARTVEKCHEPALATRPSLILEAKCIGERSGPANNVSQRRIGYLLKRPAGRPPEEVRRHYVSFHYQAQSSNKQRRVLAKVEWHPDKLYPRVGFIMTNLARPTQRIVAFYNQRAMTEQWIRESKGAIKRTRL